MRGKSKRYEHCRDSAVADEEKLQIMEALWVDLRDRFEHIPIPTTHQALLDERRGRVQNGTTELLDWDAVKTTIGH